MARERWKEVCEGYWVSSYGRVYSAARDVPCCPKGGMPNTRRKRGRILGMNLSPSGYYRVNIYRKVVHVHALVAKAFLGEPESPDLTVNHKDLNKTNNRVDNLEWVSNSDNVKHAWANGVGITRPVRCVSTGKVFASLHEAARSEGRATGNLCSHLKGRQKTFAGKVWEYAACPPWPNKDNKRDAA